MQTFVMFTRLISEEVHPSFSVREKADIVKKKTQELCPEVEWVGNYAILGGWDYLDIFTAPDTPTAMKLAALVRTHAGAHTEVWPAVEWDSFKELISQVTRAAA